MVVACATLSACASAPQALPAAPANPPAGMQFLYGSGEAAALSVQAFQALLGHVAMRVKDRPGTSVVLEQGATLDSPKFASCGAKPFAAVFDVDETLLLNLGFEYHDARTAKGYDAAAWDAWEKTGAGQVSAVPGAVEAVRGLRALGVAVIFNTNREAVNAEATALAIRNAGLGDAIHGSSLFLKGDDGMGSRKDGRRATIAAKYCVIAMGGDQLGDFSDLFNAGQPVMTRRAAAMDGPTAKLWGRGWFVLPNPVYGTALKGGFDDVFPTDKRWDMPAAKEAR
jgi:5'-nucleotidase (lipoprotein e(P4) family)